MINYNYNHDHAQITISNSSLIKSTLKLLTCRNVPPDPIVHALEHDTRSNSLYFGM